MDLPPELINKISTYLATSDVLRLGYTCRANYDLLLPQIYSSVTIDSSRLPYGAEDVDPRRSTNIKSLYSFTLFMKNLYLNQRYCSYVRVLQFMDEIPDLPELEVFHFLEKIFPNLCNLEQLKWCTIQMYLPCDLLSKVPNLVNMKSIVGNFKSFENISIFSGEYTSYHLEELLVSGFGQHTNLAKLALPRFANLKSLTLSRNSLTSTLKNSGHASSVSNFIEIPDPYTDDANYISQFSPSSLLQSITELVLKDVCVCADDAHRLSRSIDLCRIETFKLINCTEKVQAEDDFLDVLQPKMVNLTTLSLGLSNEANVNDSSIRFIRYLPSKLRKLELQVRWSSPHREPELCETVDAITAHSETLTYLDFEFESIQQNKDGYYRYTSRLQKLSQLRNLKFLRVPVNQYEIPELIRVVNNLQRLQFLQLALKDFKTPIINNNTLISQEYFDYPNSVTLNYHNTIVDQLANFCRDFKSFLSMLRYLVFEASETYFFNCYRQVVQERGLELVFGEMVKRETA